MFVNKLFAYLTWHISKSKSYFYVKSSTYYLHMKTKTLGDFQICLSVSLKEFLFKFCKTCKRLRLKLESNIKFRGKHLCQHLPVLFWDSGTGFISNVSPGALLPVNLYRIPDFYLKLMKT